MTKSYNYIPTHFLYSSLLFFLLIFMHQQTYCHTLLQPFFKIFLFRIYAPTIHSTDIEFDETSDRLPHISAPIQHPQTNPPTTQSTTAPYHTPQIPQPYSLHKPQPYSLHKHTRRRAGPTLTQTMHVDVDADAQTLMQHRCSRSPIPVRNWTGQADRIRLKTRPD